MELKNYGPPPPIYLLTYLHSNSLCWNLIINCHSYSKVDLSTLVELTLLRILTGYKPSLCFVLGMLGSEVRLALSIAIPNTQRGGGSVNCDPFIHLKKL
jgi:hypothetical protein